MQLHCSAASALLLLMLAAAASGKGMMTGGWKELSTEDQNSSEGFQGALRAATAAYNDKFAAGGSGNEDRLDASLQRIDQAWQQVVSGMKYRFKALMAACGGGNECEDDARRCEFVVWHQAWNKKQPYRVLKIDC